ncbi:MAG: secretin N-terminal domain-containing protein [Rubrivivax sp.]
MNLSFRRRWGAAAPATLAKLLAALALVGCAAGGRLHDDGMNLVARGEREDGLARLREAAQADPTNAQYRIDFLREQLLYSRELLDRADDARRAGRPADAKALYEQTLRIQPGNERATRGLAVLSADARHAALVADAERALRDGALDAARASLKVVLTENPAHEGALRAAAALAEQQARADQAKAAQAQAASVLRKPVTLQFRDANVRMVFEALSRTTGLNVILDRDVKADLKTTIFVKDASVEDTVDLILLQNQLEKRTLNASTLFIYPATAAKQKEYQDLQVRTFQVNNVDAKNLQAVLKSLLKLKEVTLDERANTLAIRDTPDAVAVAAKVIAAHDVPDPEVMLEVEVLEISRARASNIGLQLPTSFSVATPATATTLSALRALSTGELAASGLGATLNLQLQDTDTNLLASPRIRARNKEKAKILIGDRVPTITNSVTPIQSGGSVVTGSVQYQEVGLKLEFEPQIYNSQEVGIKLNLEVSNITNTFTDGQGGRSYQIGTRSAQTALRLRDGETQILGGLISDQDRNAAAKIPGLGHLPVVGAIFGNNDNSRTKTEIVLSITPRIVRAPANADGAAQIYSGTESAIREHALRLDPVGDFRAPPPAAPAAMLCGRLAAAGTRRGDASAGRGPRHGGRARARASLAGATARGRTRSGAIRRQRDELERPQQRARRRVHQRDAARERDAGAALDAAHRPLRPPGAALRRRQPGRWRRPRGRRSSPPAWTRSAAASSCRSASATRRR